MFGDRDPVRGAVATAVSRPDDAVIVCLVVTLPLAAFAPFAVGPVGIRWSWLVTLAVIALASVRVLQRGQVRLSPFLVPLAAWFVWSLLTGLVTVAGDGPVRLREFGFGVVRVGFYGALAGGILNLETDRETVCRALRALLVVAVVVCLYGLYQFFAREMGLPFAYPAVTNPSLISERVTGSTYYTGDVFARISSVFVEPSHLGMYLNDVIFVTGVALLHGRSEELLFRSRRHNLAVFGLVCVTWLVAFSLGAYATLIIAGLAWLVIDWPKVRPQFARTAPVPVVAFFVFDLVLKSGRMSLVILKRVFAVGTGALGRVAGAVAPGGGRRATDGGTDSTTTPTETATPTPTETQTATPTQTPSGGGPNGGNGGVPGADELTVSSLDVRLDRMRSGVDVWIERPLTGVGLNNYQFHAVRGEQYLDRVYGWTFNYFKLLAETGLVGLGAFLGFLGYLLWRLHALARDAVDGVDYAMARVMFGVMLVDVVSGLFYNQFFQIRFWFYLGIAGVVLAEVEPESVVTLSLPVEGLSWRE